VPAQLQLRNRANDAAVEEILPNGASGFTRHALAATDRRMPGPRAGADERRAVAHRAEQRIASRRPRRRASATATAPRSARPSARSAAAAGTRSKFGSDVAHRVVPRIVFRRPHRPNRPNVLSIGRQIRLN